MFGRATHHQDYSSATAYRCPVNQVRNNQHSAGLSHGSPLRGCALLRSPPLRGSLLIGGVATWRYSVGWRCPSSGGCPRKVVSSRWSDTFGYGLRPPLTFRGLHPSACPRHSTACPHSAPKAVFGRATHHQDYLSASAYRCPDKEPVTIIKAQRCGARWCPRASPCGTARSPEFLLLLLRGAID